MTINDIEITEVTLPAIPLKGVIPLPNNEIRIDVVRLDSKLSIKDSSFVIFFKGFFSLRIVFVINFGFIICQYSPSISKYIVLLVQKNFTSEKVNPQDLNPVGVVAQIMQSDELNGILKLVVHGIVRCDVVSYVNVLPFMRVSVTTKPFVSTDVAAEVACVRMLIKELEESGPRLFKKNPNLIKQVSNGVTADKLCDLIAFNLTMEFNLKIRYLNNPLVSERLTYVLEDLKREKYLASVEDSIEQKVRESINESQKEYYLREKMKTIQEELGDKARKDSEIDELRKKILEARMPKDIEEKLSEACKYVENESTFSNDVFDKLLCSRQSVRQKQAEHAVLKPTAEPKLLKIKAKTSV